MIIFLHTKLTFGPLYILQVLVLEPSKILMPSYVAVNKNANEEGEVRSVSLIFPFSYVFLSQ